LERRNRKRFHKDRSMIVEEEENRMGKEWKRKKVE